MAAMTVWAAVLITYGVSTGMEMVSGAPEPNSVLPLNMVPDSVDDMYNGCKDKMKSKVLTEYLPKENTVDLVFGAAWDKAKKHHNKWRDENGKMPSTTLGKEQIMAIYVYTLNKPKVYLDFNDAVRAQRSAYTTKFKYHALHFFLTDALQTLNSHIPAAQRCQTGFRRVNSSFSQDVLNKEIRFSSFTSSSMDGYLDAEAFGDKSCFEIVTCYGADISLYSKFGESEKELLIPPYEVFKVTEIERSSDQKSLPCEVVYKLKSTDKTLSKLNCALF